MIQTVTGEISKKDLGTVLMHEHISCASVSLRRAFGDKWLDPSRVEALATATLKQVKQRYGVGLFVDATPIDVGRDVLLLKAVSEASGVAIVASSGLYYFEGIETQNNGAEELAELFIDECKNGIEDTGIKPGILKCATGSAGLTEDNLKKLSTVGSVQRKSGLPLYIHCEHNGDVAFRQLAILKKQGANPERLILGHAALRPDAAYLSELLKGGCYICMDQCYCYPDRLQDIAFTLLRLCRQGYTEKLLLSNDYCVHNDFCNRSQNGLNRKLEQHIEGFSYVFDRLCREYLSIGGTEKDLQTMLCQNPVSVLDT